MGRSFQDIYLLANNSVALGFRKEERVPANLRFLFVKQTVKELDDIISNALGENNKREDKTDKDEDNGVSPSNDRFYRDLKERKCF